MARRQRASRLRMFRRAGPLAMLAALALVATACGGAAAQPSPATAPSATRGEAPSSTVEQPAPSTTTTGALTTSPTAPTSTATTPAAGPGGTATGDFTCTEVLGFSQAGSETNGGWFTVGGFESLPGIDDGAWQLRWRSSAEAIFWMDPDFDGWRDGRLFSACDEPTVDRVIVFFLHRSRNPQDYVEPMRQVAASLAERFPDLEQVVIEPMVGGPGEDLCTVPTRGGTVFSTEAHRWIDEAVELAADGFIVAGASPEVAACDQFVDKPGHLSPEGAAAVAEWMAAFYGS